MDGAVEEFRDSFLMEICCEIWLEALLEKFQVDSLKELLEDFVVKLLKQSLKKKFLREPLA